MQDNRCRTGGSGRRLSSNRNRHRCRCGDEGEPDGRRATICGRHNVLRTPPAKRLLARELHRVATRRSHGARLATVPTARALLSSAPRAKLRAPFVRTAAAALPPPSLPLAPPRRLTV